VDSHNSSEVDARQGRRSLAINVSGSMACFLLSIRDEDQISLLKRCLAILSNRIGLLVRHVLALCHIIPVSQSHQHTLRWNLTRDGFFCPAVRNASKL